MLFSSESHFETKFFKKYRSDEFGNENKLSDSLWERLSNILPCLIQRKKKMLKNF